MNEVPNAVKNPDDKVKKEKLQLVIAKVTLCSSIVAFLAVAFQLYEQKKEISKFSQAFQNLNALKIALKKPLEGIWDFNVNYTKFHNEESETSKLPRKYYKGKAIFLWEEVGDSTGYRIFFGGGIYIEGDDKVPIISSFMEAELSTDPSGIPESGFKIIGEIISRTSSDENYKSSTVYGKAAYTDGVMESSHNRITEIKMNFQTTKTTAEIIFSRK